MITNKYSNLLEGLVFTEVYNRHTHFLLYVNPEVYIHMYHATDCCEHVSIEDINGDLSDLINTPILKWEVKTNRTNHFGREISESFTWTFYTIATIKGFVDIRWLGTSNGYYSESVSIDLIYEPSEDKEINNKNIHQVFELITGDIGKQFSDENIVVKARWSYIYECRDDGYIFTIIDGIKNDIVFIIDSDEKIFLIKDEKYFANPKEFITFVKNLNN